MAFAELAKSWFGWLLRDGSGERRWSGSVGETVVASLPIDGRFVPVQCERER